MASLLSGLLGVLMATNQPAAVSNLVEKTTGAKIEVIDPNDPVEREYLKLLEQDNAVQAEVDRWITENQRLAEKGAGADEGIFQAKVRQRFEPVDRAYKDFLERNPNHTRGRIAYGSFLGDMGRDDDSKTQWEKARDLDPKNPAPWNNLANYYGHNGPTTNAFACYEKAIALKANEPIYYQNFATTVYLFRRDATNYFNISEQQVFDKAMGLYRKALALDPENFPLATDLAQTYYGIKPSRTKDALEAWTVALKLAHDDIEREGIHIHLARWQKTAGNLDEARRELSLVANQMYAVTKERILKTIEAAEAKNTNASPAQPDAK